MALILLVEDETPFRVELADLLGEHGFDIDEAEDGSEGLEKILQLRPDLVVCDIAMPGMDGTALLSRLRGAEPELAATPFVFLTAMTDRDHLLAGRRGGADDYLTKPIDPDLLIAVIKQRLAQTKVWADAMANRLADERRKAITLLAETAEPALGGALDSLNDGVILIDAKGQSVFANRGARELLARGDGLTVSGGRIAATDPLDGYRLRRTITRRFETDESDAPLYVRITRNDGLPLMLKICRLPTPETDLSRQRAAVFVTDPIQRSAPSAVALRALYDMTEAEAEIASATALGLSVDEIADTRRISVNAVRFHLRNIFQKADVKKQNELAALVWSSAPGEPAA